jgi:hypothetical protein
MHINLHIIQNGVEERASIALICPHLQIFKYAVHVESRIYSGHIETNICSLLINVTHRSNKNNCQSYVKMFPLIRIRPLMTYLRFVLLRLKLCIQLHCIATNSYTSYHIELCVFIRNSTINFELSCISQL